MALLTRLSFTVPAEDVELLPAFLSVHAQQGWEEVALSTGGLRCVLHSPLKEFCDELEAAARAFLPRVSVERETIEEADWVEAWKEFFTPVPCGKRFMVLAPWMQAEREAPGRTPIVIDPGTAFGTGHHESTALCLTALSDLADAGALSLDRSFLDLGTGSGILGIGAAKLGLRGEGLDIDPVAVDNALKNREINTVAAEAFPIARGGVEAAGGPYGLVLANILAGPLCDMAPQIARLGGDKPFVLVLSGILTVQADNVVAAYRAQGLAEPVRRTKGEWTALIFGAPLLVE